jgi:DNA-binding Lrp family transcriptional regulator
MVRQLSPEIRAIVENKLRSSGHLTNAAIARETGVSAPTVKKIRKELDVEINGEFFEQRLRTVSANVLIAVCKDPSYDPAPATTKVQDDRKLPEVSAHVLRAHRVDDPGNKKRMREIFEKENSQGFCVVSKDDSYDKTAVNELLKRFDDDPDLLELFTPIFEYTQDAPTEPQRPGKAQRTMEDRRFGEGLRLHVRLNELQTKLESRLDESEKEVRKLEAELKSARTRLDAHLKTIPIAISNKKSTRTTADIGKRNAQRLADAQKTFEDVSKALEEAKEKADQVYPADFDLAVKVRDMLCRNYQRIMKLTPYARKVEDAINDLRLLSIILTKPKAPSQTMHGDSHQLGVSLLTAARKRQHLIVLLNSFKAMRCIKKLLPKRTIALEFVRNKIAAASPEGWDDLQWDEQCKTRVWSYLCTLQMEHERIEKIKAVLVPIEEGETLVVDNCTLHGGSPGEDADEAPLAFRFHAYGYVRDILKRVKKDHYERDEDVTIDPLDVQAGYYPLCRWAQKSPAVFRA